MKIVIWTGAAWEPWGPSSIANGGIGGSETAAIHVGFELCRRGHEVVMFGDHEGWEGWYSPALFDNWIKGPEPTPVNFYVRYRHYKEALADPKLLDCDVLVSSRDKRVARLHPDARVKVLWVHDVHCGDDWENDVPWFDLVYALSRWHQGFLREVYPHVEPDKISITSNGIDPARFRDLDWSRKTASFVYSSSPDRGLDVLLDMWPDIRKARPDATLDVYYGFDNWRKLNAENKRGLLVADYLEGRIREMKAEGVSYHGRVGQDVIAEAYKRSVVWLYPTAFHETFAITALEAQAAGNCVVTSMLAGLCDTANLWPTIAGRNKSPEYKRTALDQALLHLAAWEVDKRAPGGFQGSPKARAAREWALTRTWASVASSWECDFEEIAKKGGRTGAGKA